MTENEFKEEVKRIRPLMISIAVRYSGDDDMAEDIVQDILVKLWQLREQLHSPLNGFAGILVRNRCIDIIRRQPATVAADDGLVEECHVADERLERVMAIIDTLPTLQQTIIHMRHMQGMEMADIAEVTGSTEAAVRKTLSRARKAIRDQFINGR